MADSKRLVGRDDPQGEREIEALAKLPPELEREMGNLDRMFWVDKKKLKQISERFGEELAEVHELFEWKEFALTRNQGCKSMGRTSCVIKVLSRRKLNARQPMNVTWVQGFPTGRETGEFLTIDLGGTNLRVCWIILKEQKGKTEVTQNQYILPDELKTGDAEPLWTFIAESLESFIQEHKLKGTDVEPLNLGFTFSYPAQQDRIDHGVLTTWTKGFDIKGVEGEDVAGQLRQAIKKKDLPVHLVALINDTTGAMIASAYNDPDTIIGAIFGTGCNAAYMENCGSIPKLKDSSMNPDTPMAINCEYGAFDNARKVLPLTKYDEQIDADSPRPGEQAFEKMSAGLYLGEIYRLVVVDLHGRGLMFKGQDIVKLSEPYSLDTGFLSHLENDESPKLSDTRKRFQDELNISITEPELELSRRLAEVIAVRGARMCTCGVAAICRKKGIEKGHIAADGSVANKHPKFKKRWAAALAEILEWPNDRREDPITMTSAEDGSGIGAAVVSAMAMARARQSQRQGSKMQQ